MNKISVTEFEVDEFVKLLVNELRPVLRDELKAELSKEFQQKLLSPSEACKIFQPAISKPTLTSWTNQGLLKDYRIGGRVFYRYGEIVEAGKHLKRYKNQVV